MNRNFINSADAQAIYHYTPGLGLTGSNYQDVTSTDSLQLSQFSVAAWFRTSTNFASDAIIVNKGGLGSESSGQNMNYGIWMTKSEKIIAGFESTTAADRFVTSAKTYNDNQWHYVILTYGGSNVILYIDGVKVATKSTSGASPEISGTKPVRIGANSRVTPPGNFFTGQVDEVRVWNDDLTTQQVADAFAGISFSTEEQVLYLPFDSNPPPVANNQAITVNKNTQKAITLTATDPNNDPLTYTVLTQPAHGTLTGTAPNLNYNPDTDYVGADSFTFNANDGTVNSNTATVSITVEDVSSCTTILPISGVTASGNDGNVPSNVLDNNLDTRWSSSGIGQWIRADLGSTKNICSVDIAWYKGNERSYSFVISTSTDGTTFTTKLMSTSSGTTLNSEKYAIPSTDARYVRITVNGNTANNWASITELDVFGSGGSPSAVDIFGIKKLYPTKSNGEEWYINMANPTSDSRFNPQNTITQNPDGSWKMKATQVRMNVYTSTGYNSANIPTLDHSVIASKGYMLASNDWRNFEMTQYVKVNTSPSDDNLSPYGRGGRHTGDGAPQGCEGSSMKGDVFFSGKVRFAKEQWHVSYVFTSLKTATSSIEDKWIGLKFIVYNFVENNKIVVKTELWLDINNNGNFVKYDENVDRGGWGTQGVECGGAPDQIIRWGGPITTFRWDTATDVDFKNLSVREILPPQ